MYLGYMYWTIFFITTLLISWLIISYGWFPVLGTSKSKLRKWNFGLKKITYIKKINFLAITRLFNFVNSFFFFCQFPKCRKNKQWVNPVIVVQDFSLSWNQSCRPFISSFSFPPPPVGWWLEWHSPTCVSVWGSLTIIDEGLFFFFFKNRYTACFRNWGTQQFMWQGL